MGTCSFSKLSRFLLANRPSVRLSPRTTSASQLLPLNKSRFYSIMAIAENYDEVLKGKYPAKEHARKVAKWIVEKGGDKNGTLYLEAQKLKLNEDNDGEAPFRYAKSLR
jgi:hypothetical protein